MAAQQRKWDKVFCIGMNKTGTTSLEAFMRMHGYSCGDQAGGELLISDYAKKNWKPILDFTETAEFFQDLPFSAPGTYVPLMEKYPNAAFILTLRTSPEEWYHSLVNFHKKVFGKPLNADCLKRASYRYKGFAWEANRALYPSPENDPYRKEDLIRTYEDHRDSVLSFFRNQPNFLSIQLNEKNVVQRLSNFLEIEPQVSEMPWLNRTNSL